jgi:hypothetical protein
MKIQIILEVEADEIDWGKSSVYPAGNGLFDFDLDTCRYQGQPIEFADADKACDYLEFCWGESDKKDYRYA